MHSNTTQWTVMCYGEWGVPCEFTEIYWRFSWFQEQYTISAYHNGSMTTPRQMGNKHNQNNVECAVVLLLSRWWCSGSIILGQTYAYAYSNTYMKLRN